MKVVHTDAYGGYPDWHNGPLGDFWQRPRHDPELVAFVEAMAPYTRKEWALVVAEVPGRKYWIEEYDGRETVWTPESIPWIEVPE